MGLKRIYFYLILPVPALFLLSIVIIIGLDLYEISTVSPGQMEQGLHYHLAHEEPEHLPLPDNMLSRSSGQKSVFIFGESSLVLSDGRTFPDYLALEHTDLQIVNFGVSGIDSFIIRQRVKEALSVAKPDVIVLYYGHNDYNNAYQEYIIPNYFQQFDPFLGFLYLFHSKKDPVGVLLPEDPYWFSRLTRPKFIQFFEQLGLIDIKVKDYEQINRLILEHCIENTNSILGMASSLRIPVVIITPVGNLHAEPFGDVHTTTELYRKGTAASDYSEALQYLKKARDTEIFTYDLRAKSPLIEYVRHLNHPNVYILDLEKKLEDRHFSFSYADFLDYFHFNDKSHRMLAGIIYEFMDQNRLVHEDGAHTR